MRVELSFSLLRLWGLAAAGALTGFLLFLFLTRVAGGDGARGAAVFASAVWVFGTVVALVFALEALSRRQRRMQRLNRELLALHQAALAVHGEPDLDLGLQRITDEARRLIDTRYGALSVLDDAGAILAFVTSGITAAERARLGDPPRGHGLLGVALHQGEALRVADIGRDPRAAGFPAGHPTMRTLLAVPVAGAGAFKGNLYLAEKADGKAFTDDDEATLRRFATTAALAIDNARLNRGRRSEAVTEERLRIAREMHDGLAQVLAYVNTKAQAVSEFLGAGDVEEARHQLDQLAAAAREVAVDAREGILSLRSAGGDGGDLAETLARYIAQWGSLCGIAARLDATPGVRLEAHQELQIVRIVQEALANVRKHAGARHAEVRLRRDGAGVQVEIADDGVGFDPALPRAGEQPRFGLATMRERAHDVGGTLEVVAAAGRGTTVRVRVPGRAAN